MGSHDVNRTNAYATAAAGCVLSFLTLGSAVVFLDVATIGYFELPQWMLAAVLAVTVSPVAWFSIRLFARARDFELQAQTVAAEPVAHVMRERERGADRV